jgi:hypothetical protein
VAAVYKTDKKSLNSSMIAKWKLAFDYEYVITNKTL